MRFALGALLHAVLMISLFIDESITLSPCPPIFILMEYANFFMEETKYQFLKPDWCRQDGHR
jgi:hypothetical protein